MKISGKFILLSFIAGALLSCNQPKNRENKELVRAQFERWQKDSEGFFDLLDEDAVWVVGGRSPVSGTYKGKDDFMKRAVRPITENFATPLQPELVSLTADDTYVWLHFTASATTAAGDLYENSYLWKLELENGKIIRGFAFLDTFELATLMNESNSNAEQTVEEPGR